MPGMTFKLGIVRGHCFLVFFLGFLGFLCTVGEGTALGFGVAKSLEVADLGDLTVSFFMDFLDVCNFSRKI
jgi:hypothetical protein